MAKAKTAESPTIGAHVAHKSLPIQTMADLATAGEILSRTKVFGDISPADGFVIASICYQNDISYDEFAETYNWMHGRLSKKTDAMLTDFHVYGGRHQIIERSATIAKAEFSFGDNKYVSEVTFDTLKKEPFIYNGKESDILAKIKANQFQSLVLKAKYSTDRSRMQMLWARCVSDGIRVVCPAACKGIYTPEETSDFVEEEAPRQAVPSVPDNSFSPPQISDPPKMIEVCPVGPLKGQRWDSLSTEILKQAMNVEHQLFTPEMKNYIEGIIKMKEVSND